MPHRLLLMLGLTVCCGQAAEPLRLVVLTRLSQSLPDALRRFEERWGTGRIALTHGGATAPPAGLGKARGVLGSRLPAQGGPARPGPPGPPGGGGGRGGGGAGPGGGGGGGGPPAARRRTPSSRARPRRSRCLPQPVELRYTTS